MRDRKLSGSDWQPRARFVHNVHPPSVLFAYVLDLHTLPGADRYYALDSAPQYHCIRGGLNSHI